MAVDAPAEPGASRSSRFALDAAREHQSVQRVPERRAGGKIRHATCSFTAAMRNLRLAILWLTGLLPFCGLSGNAVVSVDSPLLWQRTAVGVDSDGATALALDPGSERVAVGDARGVLVGSVPSAASAFGPSPSGPVFKRVLYRGPVRDLAFTDAGRLLVAAHRPMRKSWRDSPTYR
jgi:hypothetical protein